MGGDVMGSKVMVEVVQVTVSKEDDETKCYHDVKIGNLIISNIPVKKTFTSDVGAIQFAIDLVGSKKIIEIK